MVCVGGGIDINPLVEAAVCCVCGLVLGGGGGVGVTLLVVGGAGVGVALAGGLGILVGRVGVACARCAVLAVLGWLRCRGVVGRRLHGRLGGAVVRRQWVAASGRCSLARGVGGSAAGGGGAFLRGPGFAGVRVRLPAGQRGCTVVRMSCARAVGVVGGAGSSGGDVEGVLVVCGTLASASAVVGAGGGGIRDGLVR